MSAARLVALALAVEVLAGALAVALFLAWPFCDASLVALAVMAGAGVVVMFA